ncbi:dGTP triphosphohydrolase [Archangium lipolyticum]|uniref:dGTP triphosphohydrolase n=1 Tax=Archangium lipolyticum TaxID=2970465 RepID=UPI00214A13B2|nr:dNTP triphosphohydrolase [Archangium lipolyticum]
MALDWNKLLCATRIREILRGRASASTPGDIRSEFERDHDRTVFSTPVRRLQDKTQVFPLEPNDAVRTRLTHSLEVSTLARGLTRGATGWLVTQGEIAPARASDIESIAATCGLIHDLGNPPFGHAGEAAISSWFEKKRARDTGFFGELERSRQLQDDFLHFEGNAQTLRIVSRLQILADQYGLNLTVGTLSAAMKYTASSDALAGPTGPHEKEKPGYFASEREIVEAIREHSGTGDVRNPIAYLVEACDDMVYATVDIEDGVKKGVISWPGVEDAFEHLTSKPSAQALESIQDHIRRASDYIDQAATELSPKARGEAIAQHFRTLVIGTTKQAVLETFASKYQDIINGTYHGELIKDSSAAGLIKACKSVGRAHIYRSEETLRLETMGRRIIHDLMDFFWEGASAYDPSMDRAEFDRTFQGKIYNLLSSNYRAVFETSIKSPTLPIRYHQFQLVTDYVCGMTDSFACKLHSQLTHG